MLEYSRQPPVAHGRLLLVAILVQYLSLLSSGCALIQDKIIEVADRNLHLQAKYGFGEGLAKGVPGQPLLINNRLYSMSDDPVLGIRVATRKIAETVPLFEQMNDLPLVMWTRELLAKQRSGQPWMKLQESLSSSRQQLILEPYCVIEGAPNAVLQLRIRIVLKDSEKNIWSGQLEETIERLPLEGSGSWSENNAERLVVMSKDALPAILAKVPTYVKEKNDMPKVFYRP